MGRATSGVSGMKFRADDELLAMDVVREEAFLFTVTQGGIAKRTALTVENYRVQGRGGLGIKVANLPEANGDLVGALVTDPEDEVLVIMERGKIVRSATAEVNATGRTTQGVIFAKPDNGDRIIAVARNIERHLGDEAGTVGDSVEVEDVTSAVLEDTSVTTAPEAPAADETSEEDA
jgi:DNA gyrase subunit A